MVKKNKKKIDKKAVSIFVTSFVSFLIGYLVRMADSEGAFMGIIITGIFIGLIITSAFKKEKVKSEKETQEEVNKWIERTLNE